MGKSKNIDDRPPYLSGKEAKYSIGTNRGPFPPADGSSQLEAAASAGGLSLEDRQLTVKEKIMKHQKRFWFVYFIGNIIFLAILLPILFEVVVPAVAQLVVNKSTLILTSAKVMEPRPDSVLLSLESKLNLHVLLHVRTEPIMLQLYLDTLGPQYPWGNVTIPAGMIVGNQTLGVQDQPTTFENKSTWLQYTHDVVYEKDFALSLRGQGMAFIGVLKNHVYLEKTIQSPALNKFNGFFISDSTLLLPARPDGTNLIGNVMLPNPSVLTLEIGTIVLSVKSGNLVIGTATLENVTLRPGNNTFPLTGSLNLATLIANLPEVLRSQAAALKQGNLALATVAQSVVWNGTLVPYYTEVMNSLTLIANVPVADLLKNTIGHLTHGGKLNLTQVVNSMPAGGLLGSGSSNSSAGSRMLARALKQNLAVRNAFGDAFKDDHPVKRDAVIDSLAGLSAPQQ